MNNNFDANSLHEIHHKYMKINRLHRWAAENKFAGCRIHRSQHGLLMYLSHVNKTPTQKELADHFEVSPAAIANSMKRLEADGYIKREINVNDARQNMIFITDKGRAVVEFSKSTFEELDRKTYGCLTEDELICLDKILTKMLNSLEEVR